MDHVTDSAVVRRGGRPCWRARTAPRRRPKSSGGTPWAATWARRSTRSPTGFNKSQTEYKVIAGLQGLLHRDPDRRDRRLPRQAGAAHRAGLRGRHRQHDGRQGRGLSGLSADGRRQGAVRSQGLSSARSTATTRRPTASCCRCRSTPRRRCSTGTRSCFTKAGLDPNKPPKTWPELGEMAKKAVAAGAKCGFTPQWQTWTMIENYGAWHNLPYATKDNGFGGTDIELKFNDAAARQAHPDAGRLEQGQDASSTAAARASRRRCSPPATASSTSPRRRTASAIDKALGTDKFGIAMMPYSPDVAPKPQNSIIGGATLWVLQGKPKDEYKGVAKFLTYLSSAPVQAKWHQETGYVPITLAAAEHHREGGLLQEVPGPRHRGEGAHAQPADRELQGPAHRQLRADPRRRRRGARDRCGPARRTPRPRSTRR